MSKTDPQLTQLLSELENLANPQRAAHSARFFKTAPGEYGEGDIFRGIPNPPCRELVRKYRDLSLGSVQHLLDSKYHEDRMVGILILVEQYRRGDQPEKEKVYHFYLENRHRVNNWDLVDLSAHKIVGPHLYEHPDRKELLYNYAKSDNLWERRIAVISTFYFLSKGDSADSLRLAKLLLADKHDLIHKAVGWMLREMGKRVGESVLTDFLEQYAARMPRTMLRYSIERLAPAKRQHFMNAS